MSIDDSDIPEKAPTPLPRLQMTVLMFLLLSEPVSGFVIYPFIAQVSDLFKTFLHLKVGSLSLSIYLVSSSLVSLTSREVIRS